MGSNGSLWLLFHHFLTSSVEWNEEFHSGSFQGQFSSFLKQQRILLKLFQLKKITAVKNVLRRNFASFCNDILWTRYFFFLPVHRMEDNDQIYL